MGRYKEVIMPSFVNRLQHAWNAFMGRDPTETVKYRDIGLSFGYRPDRPRFSRGNERTIVTAVYNRLAIDVASVTIEHVRFDENGRFKELIDSKLNRCLTLEANLDQSGREFIQDIAMSMFDEGCVAIVPTDTTLNPKVSNSYDILSMRTGKVLEWYPQHVKVRVYNEKTGKKEDITLPKRHVAIVENPFYAVMNEPNSTAKRLIRKLSLLDAIDEQNGSGKLDLIIQLPYDTRSNVRKQQAETRRSEIVEQLENSAYGIAYIGATEHITQLNRSVDNQLMSQIEYLTRMLYSQLGITEEIMNGTASEAAMTSYNARTIEPILSAITDSMKRKFLTQTAISQRQSIYFFKDPFKLVPVSNISEIADKFTRNEIMTSNEIRQVIGMLPSNDPKADELRNKNLSMPKEELQQELANRPMEEQIDENQV